jgi:iron complex outermembrane receptor protein
MKKNLLSLVFLLFLTTGIIAQNRTVTGKIISEDDGLGLPGVSVIIKGTARGTTTNFDGNYTITGLSETDVLVFSFIGFQQQEVTVGTNTNIPITMHVSANELNEVIVTGLGVKRQKREIGYSTDNIDADVLVRSNAPNVINAIIGRSAGVQVSQGDGVEGGSTRITIRGNNSLNGDNQPLIVVDNVPMENTPGLEDIGRGVDWGNALSDLNPEDIETYTILKGGAASALYGSRGADGVILITTKRGKKQTGIGVDYSYSYKMIQPYGYRDAQNVYGAGGPISFTPPTFPMSGDTLLYPGVYGNDHLIINQDGDESSTTAEFGYYGSAVSWGPKMEGQMVKWWDGKMRAYSPQPDNFKSVYQNGSTQTHNIAVSGGGEFGTLRVSITRQDHKSIVDNSDFDRTTVNVGSTINISKKVRADITMSYVSFNRLNSPMLGEHGNSFSKGYLYSWPRSYQGIDKENYTLSDGSRNLQEGYPFYYINKHLWWDYYKNNTNMHRDKYFGALTLTYDITSWLNILGRLGKDFSLEQFEKRNAPVDVLGLENGYYANSLKRNNNNTYDFILTAEKKVLSKLNFKFTAGSSRWEKDIYGISGHSGTWVYPNMYSFFNMTEYTFSDDGNGNSIVDQVGNSATYMLPGETIWRQSNNSIFAFLNLSYSNYLFLEITARNDWSSTLPEGQNSYFYPGASLSFIATEAFPIQEKINWLNFVKLRGGVSQTATDTGPYQTSFYYGTGTFGGMQTSSFPGTIPPFTLRPQRVNSYEAGINLGFLENRIDFDFTYYYLYSFDQIMPGLPIPTSSGSPRITINEGVVKNTGFEINLNAVPIRNNNIVFKTGINYYRNRNYIVSLGEYADVYPLADIWGLNGPAMALREGDEFGTIYGYDYVYHENGQPIVNDEGTKYLITDTRVPIGNASPDFLGGWTMQFSYKGFMINTLVDTKWGGDIYAGSYVINLQTGQSPETLIEREGGGLPYTDPDGNTSNIGVILPGVFADGTPNDKVVHYYYKYLPNAGGWGKFLSTPGVVENTWVKMREIALTYYLPEKLLRKTKVFQKLSLSIVGRDLFYFYTTLPDGINPEGIMGSGSAQGFEWASMPSSRSFTFGLKASF